MGEDVSEIRIVSIEGKDDALSKGIRKAPGAFVDVEGKDVSGGKILVGGVEKDGNDTAEAMTQEAAESNGGLFGVDTGLQGHFFVAFRVMDSKGSRVVVFPVVDLPG